MYLRSVSLRREEVASFDVYPYSIPAIRALHSLELDPAVTFFVGENGSGKSTLVEGIAVAAGFNAEGGSKNFNFASRNTESELHRHIQLVRGMKRERDGYFMRAESLYNVATQVDDLRVGGYGPRSLHAQSHGEAFLALALHRFRGNGLYILDEPEAALSPQRQLSLLVIIDQLVRKQASQLIIATHSPILIAYPRARIYLLDAPSGTIETIRYEDTEHYQITRDFLTDRGAFLRDLLEGDGN
ncbi:MAG: AAA family ATPase [Chloroflexota bacterium]|nr:AAA family ATPase [Chloroflexota bacterium]